MNVRFDLKNDDGSKARARDDEHHIARTPDGSGYLIAFAGGENVHEVVLNRGPDGWTGDCHIADRNADRTERCPGWAHHDGPCAHLWAVRSYIARERRESDDQRHADNVDKATEVRQ